MSKQTLPERKKVKLPKLIKFRFLSNRQEPKDKTSHDLLANDETVLVEDSMFMKQRFREVAQKIRRIKAHKR